jgi:hypothetical protein
MVKKIKIVMARKNLKESTSAGEDRQYWFSRSPAERIEAVEILRREFYGNAIGLQRIVRVVERTRR